MCSISGMISNESGSHEAVERMVAALNHRGPDDRGISDCGLRIADSEVNVSLGNTRLAIIDLSPAGHQPMRDEEAGLTLTYNGETYNFEELRRELGTSFGPWRSQTDTEVVLRAYRRWGVEAFSRLRGMFALAIWDERKRELVLARDTFGIKPLYYAVLPQSRFVFASEVRALLASGVVPKYLSPEGINSYLQYGSVKAPDTIVRDVRSLMPGKFIRVRLNNGELQIEDESFRSPSDFVASEEVAPATRNEAVTVLREKLKESLHAHLVSDVPLGVFLSGGMDSSALVALMGQVTCEPPKTFSVVFDEQQFTEAPHSRTVAERFKTDHQEVHLSKERLLQMLPEAIAALDQPTMDGINTFVVSKAVKDAGITVALSGLGADELFAGYSTFRRALRMGSVSSFAKRILRSASGIGNAALASSVQQRKFWQLAASDGSPEAVYSVTRQLFAPEEVGRIAERIADCGLRIAEFGNGSQQRPNAEPKRIRADEIRNPKSEIRNSLPAIRNSNSAIFPDTVNAISRLELQGYMSDTLLRDTDCTSMAHSLEVRVPFLDIEIASYVLALPGEWKLNGFNGNRPKPLLADAVSELLPAEFLQRPKMGFTLPFEQWMQSSLRKEISRVFDRERSLAMAGLNAKEVVSVWTRFLRAPGSVGWSRPWSLYVLIKWSELNGVRLEA